MKGQSWSLLFCFVSIVGCNIYCYTDLVTPLPTDSKLFLLCMTTSSLKGLEFNDRSAEAFPVKAMGCGYTTRVSARAHAHTHSWIMSRVSFQREKPFLGC